MASSTASPVAGLADLSRDELRFVWEHLAQAQRHADSLLNARLQGFVVGTSVLMAAFSQFRDRQYTYIAVAICLIGMVFSSLMHRALAPTAKMSRWYIEVLREIDVLVFPNDLGPYATRRRVDEQVFGQKGAVLELTAHTVPCATFVVWIVLGLLYFAANYWLKVLP